VTVRAVAVAYNRHQARIAHLATARTAAQWSAIDPADISGSWATSAGPAMARTLTAAQRVAAAGAPAYTQAAVQAQGASYDAQGAIDPGAFAGTAADGRALASLLYLPVIDAKTAIAGGMSATDALDRAAAMLARLVATETADAGRDALAAQMTATRVVHGYVRMVAGSACGRCIVLAGRWYHANAGFQRHPHCQCTAIPAVENAPDLRTDPHAFFDHLTKAQQDARFGAADAEAIRNGADLFQVVNAHRGLTERELFGRTVQTTTEGMTRRGYAAQIMRANGVKGPRLSVAQIFADAGEDRDLALSLLRRYAYIR
jgi:hypothetical protein